MLLRNTPQETHLRFIDGMQKAVKMAERAGIVLGVEIMHTPYLNSLSNLRYLNAIFRHLILWLIPMSETLQDGTMMS